MIKIWNYGKTLQRRVKEFAVRNECHENVAIFRQFLVEISQEYSFQILVDDLLVYNGMLDKYNAYGLVTFVKENGSNENVVEW